MRGLAFTFVMRNYTRASNSTLISLICLLTAFVYSASASGTYMNALRNGRNQNIMADKLYKWLFGKKGGESGDSNETNPIKTNGNTLPPITENPHLEEIDEKYSLCNGIDIREITITQIQELFAANKLSSVELTKCYIERIEKMNGVLKTVNEINPDALAEAAKADVERKLGKHGRGPMHGIPVLLKENIATFDRMETTAGSLALVGLRPKRDAAVVKALRKSGAVILGKANLSEFAYFRGTNIPSGWSGRGGQTRNAYNLNVTPEGSSSGSAVSVSSNLAVVSIGTETDGSLIAPANVAGICTMKPTHGIPSIQGIIPISSNQDHAGPMARTVTDLAILLDAMIPSERRHANHPSNFTQSTLKPQENIPFRIGVMRYPFFNTSAINSTNLEHNLEMMNDLLDKMKNSIELEIIDPINPEKSLLKNVSGDKELLVLTYDFKHDFNEYLRTEVATSHSLPIPSVYSYSTKPDNVSDAAQERRKIASLKDVIQYNEEHPTPEGYNQELLIMSEATDGIHNETYIKARDANRDAARQVLDSVLLMHNLDAVVSPSESRYDGILDEDLKDSSVLGYSLAAIAGYPSINVPVGIGLKDVPFGITFIGVPNSEATLLQIAYIVEKLNPARTSPKFLI